MFLLRGVDAVQDVLRRHKLHYTLLVALVVVVASALLVEEFERGIAGANIKTLPDSLWWAVTTITTVGYGDRFPVSAAGRGIAVVLMFIGVGIFGLLAASLASFFIERDLEQGQQEEEREADSRLDDISARLERIERLLSTAESSESPANPPGVSI